MIPISNRFFSLMLALLAIGAFNFNALFFGNQSENVASTHFPMASAIPVVVHINRRYTKPRIGIVIKPGGKKIQMTVNNQNISTANAAAPKRPAFTEETGRKGIKMQLEKLQSATDLNPLMAYQQHLNRANSKLSSLKKRSPMTKQEMRSQLEKRKLSILARRSEAFLATRSLSASRYSAPPPASEASPRAGKRYVNPRLGYTKNAHTGLAGHRRLLGGLMSGVLGNAAPPAAAAAGAQVPPASSPYTQSSSLFPNVDDSDDHKGSSSASSSLPLPSSKQVAKGAGYPLSSLQAISNPDLYPAAEPDAEKSLGLDIESNDIGYVVTVQIGSRRLPFRLLVDSGSADTWIASTKCTECSNKHQKLGETTSSTYSPNDSPFSITYGTGHVEGHLATDSLYIAGLALQNHTFGIAKIESKEFSDETVPFDGLMGLAKSELSNAHVATPIDALFKAGQVTDPVMGYHLGRVSDGFNDGEVTFGGVDAMKFNGSLTEIPNVSNQGFWEAAIDKISFDGQDLGLVDRTAILDTGTTLMLAPKADADLLHSKIPGARPDGHGGYTIPCTTTQSISLTFQGKEFVIDPKDMFFFPVDSNNLQGDCVSSISSGQVGQDNEWLVGAPFLKNVYFATNSKTNSIGLAPLSNNRNKKASFAPI